MTNLRLRNSALALTGAAALTTLLTACGGSLSSSFSTTPKPASGAARPAPGDSTRPSPSASASDAPSTASNGTVSAGPTTGGAATKTSSSGSKGTGTGATTASGSRCTSSQLRASAGANDPGAGQENFPVVLTNVSGRTCTVYGYPGLEFDNASHQAVTPDPQREGGTKTVVTLKPGKSAWAPMSFSNPEISGATTVTPEYLVITPPDETHSLTVTWSGGAVPSGGNASTIHVGVFAAGSGV
jgi:Protein of unknown function (DUF4232)